MQKLSKIEMAQRLGNWGISLYDLCRGIDDREVTVSRVRKSISKETTFADDVNRLQDLLAPLNEMLEEVREILTRRYSDRQMKSLVVKLKFSDFTQTTIERSTKETSPELCKALLLEGWKRGGQKSVRLLGVGVKLAEDDGDDQQMEMEI